MTIVDRRGALYGVAFWVLLCGFGLVVWPVLLALPKLTWRWKLTWVTARLLCICLAIPFETDGGPLVGKPCVYVANHESFLDSFAIGLMFAEPVVFVAGGVLRASQSSVRSSAGSGSYSCAARRERECRQSSPSSGAWRTWCAQGAPSSCSPRAGSRPLPSCGASTSGRSSSPPGRAVPSSPWGSSARGKSFLQADVFHVRARSALSSGSPSCPRATVGRPPISSQTRLARRSKPFAAGADRARPSCR